MLRDKVAVVYGAGGGIGGAVSRALGREGARVFVTGRDLASVEMVAKEIVRDGGYAEAAEVDALDELAVDTHLRYVMDEERRVDISFNAVGIPNADIVGVPLTELDVERFSEPIAAYTRSYFLTARLAARRMLANKSGVIMTVTALLSRTGIPLVGGYGPAQAAKEALTRGLSAELAPHGIRVVGLRPQGMPETRTIRDAYEPRAEAAGMTWEEWQASLASRTHSTTAHDARGDGERGGVHGIRSSERDDRNDRQPDDGQPGRLASRAPRPVPRLELVAGVVCVDHAAHVAASADRQPREHELALVAAELRVLGLPVVRLCLRQALDTRHADDLLREPACGLGLSDLATLTPGPTSEPDQR